MGITDEVTTFIIIYQDKDGTLYRAKLPFNNHSDDPYLVLSNEREQIFKYLDGLHDAVRALGSHDKSATRMEAEKLNFYDLIQKGLETGKYIAPNKGVLECTITSFSYLNEKGDHSGKWDFSSGLASLGKEEIFSIHGTASSEELEDLIEFRK